MLVRALGALAAFVFTVSSFALYPVWQLIPAVVIETVFRGLFRVGCVQAAAPLEPPRC